MHNLLFPYTFKPIGWFLFIPTLILGILRLFSVFNFHGMTEIIVNDVTIIGIITGALFIVCSREKIEDEMTKSIRLSSLLNSLYFYAAILIVCTVSINSVSYLYFSIANLALFPIIFVVNFRLEMYRYNKMSKDEE